MSLHLLVKKQFRRSCSAPGQHAIVYKSTELPPTKFGGFSRQHCRVCTFRVDNRDLRLNSLVAPSLHAQRPVYSLLYALLHAPSAPRPLWRMKQATLSPAGSRAHMQALVLRLRPGRFFFFYSLTSCSVQGPIPFASHSREYTAAAEIGGNRRITGRFVSEDHSCEQHVATSSVNEQLGGLTGLNHLSFTENKRISNNDHDHYNADESFSPPSNYISAYPWTTAHPNDRSFDTFANSAPSQVTKRAFAAGAAYKNGPALPITPNPYAWEAPVPTASLNNDTLVPFVNSDHSQLKGSIFAPGATHNNSIALSTAPNPYTWGPAPPTAHSNNGAFAPFLNSNHSQLRGNVFAADATHIDGNTPTAPAAYTWETAAAIEPMNNYIGAGIQFPDPPPLMDPFPGADFHYPDPSLPMMSPFADVTNGIGDNYQGHYHQDQFPAPSFDVQTGPAVQAPTASHAAAPSALAPSTAQRPTCPTCDQSFSRKADLERHARVHRPGSKVHRCPHAGCGYSSTRKDKLNEHARRPH